MVLTPEVAVSQIETNFPTELRSLDQWVVWKLLIRDGEEKPTKVPYDPRTEKRAKSDDPATWGSFQDASDALLRGGYDGMGYMFSEDDPYTGVDFDACVVDGLIDPQRLEFIHQLNSYTEFSPSNTGIHTIVRGTLPEGRRKHTQLKIEMYDTERYFTVTGAHVEGMPLAVMNRQKALTTLHGEIFSKPNPSQSAERTAPSADILSSDMELWELMFQSQSGIKIRQLWEGDTSAHDNDDSSADQALCNHLAFWTGRDDGRMDRMFRQSGLMRPKWERADYRKRTIDKAIASSTEVYSGIRRLANQATRDIQPLPDAPSLHLNGNGVHKDPAFSDRPHNTDMGNAQRMYAIAKDKLLCVPQFGRWYVWVGTHYQEDTSFAVLAMAKQTVLNMYKELAEFTDDDKRKDFLKWIVQSESRPRLESMIALLRSEPGISVAPDSLDRHAMLLPVKNGTIDLRTGDLLPSDPAHKFTKCLDIAYEPSAECPLWERFLIRIMNGNLELVSFIQRLVGHALTGDATGKYFVLMLGPKGNNGKSTLAETIMRLLGDYALKSPTEMIMAKSYRGGVPNDIARLRGVRFTVTNEVDEGMTLSEGIVKDLTGKDTLTARFMRGEYFDFEPTHKLWVYGNHKPEIRGTDPAIWDRVKLIPFDVEIPPNERDPLLQSKLEQELPGILTWAVRGCLAWQKMGISEPEIVKLATDEYQTEQDALGRFLDDCCERGTDCKVHFDPFYRVYMKWCGLEGIEPFTKTKLGTELTRRGYNGDRTRVGRFRTGLQLNAYGSELAESEIPTHWSDRL